MKKLIVFLTIVLLVNTQVLYASDTTIVAPSSEAAEGLDLTYVSELFKEAENMEAFEKAINDPESGVNNLDLDGNGEVDYIRVVDQMAQDTHVIVLQAAIGKDEFQDVATIEVEKSGEDYNMQVRGNAVIYGANYYIAPTHVHIRTWPLIAWIYRPIYRPYHSRFYFGVYPHWWRPFRPVHINVYRKRNIRYHNRRGFVITKTSHVRTVGRVHYKPRTSVRVTKRVTVRKNTGAHGKKTTVRKTTVKKTTVKKKGHKTTVKKTKTTRVRKKKHR